MREGSREIGVMRGERRYVAGDPVRGLACLAVLGVHCAFLVSSRITGVADPQATWGESKGRLIWAFQIAVYIFFTISGYLISRPFIRAFTYGGKQPNLGRYFERRLLRVVPAFWVACIALLVIYGAANGGAAPVVAMFGFAQTYKPGLVNGWMGQAWTLDCEMLFYFLLPLTAILLAVTVGRLRRGPVRLLLVAAILIGGALVAYQLRWLGVGVGHRGAAPLALLRAFLPGVGLAALEVLAVEKFAGKRWAKWLAFGCVAAGIATLGLEARTDPNSLNVEWIGVFCGGFFVAGPLIWEWATGRAWRVLDNRPFQWIGERSYSIYLLHAIVIGKMSFIVSATRPRTTQLATTFLIVTAITVFFSYFLYRFVEVPFMQLGRRGLFRRRQPQVAVEAA